MVTKSSGAAVSQLGGEGSHLCLPLSIAAVLVLERAIQGVDHANVAETCADVALVYHVLPVDEAHDEAPGIVGLGGIVSALANHGQGVVWHGDAQVRAEEGFRENGAVASGAGEGDNIAR